MEQNNGGKCAIIGQKELSIAYVDSWYLTISLLTYITSSLGLSREKQMTKEKQQLCSFSGYVQDMSA